jgi:hypothetical protein
LIAVIGGSGALIALGLVKIAIPAGFNSPPWLVPSAP